MEMDDDDRVLHQVASDGVVDYPSWPALLPVVLSRIEKIAVEQFPIPHIPRPRPPSSRSPRSPPSLPPLPSSDSTEGPEAGPDRVTSSHDTIQENTLPSSPVTVTNNVDARASARGLPSTGVANSAPLEPSVTERREVERLPPVIVSMLQEVTSTLAEHFTRYPPHTIQRLTELVLSPRRHYRHLVAWLHALDRVVHVTSGANVYPLPPAVADMGSMSVVPNGTVANHTAASHLVGSDEALGGALLTPIPWLANRTNGGAHDDGSSDTEKVASPVSPATDGSTTQSIQLRHPRRLEGQVRTESTETIDGPNGMGRIETVSVSVNGIPSTGASLVSSRGGNGSVTPEELDQQEQRLGVATRQQIVRQQDEHRQDQEQPEQQEQLAQAQQRDPEHQVAQSHTASPSDSPSRPSAGRDRNMEASETADVDSSMADGGEEVEIPHARGPDGIGAVDVGLQNEPRSHPVVTSGGSLDLVNGLDVEAAVGRRAIPSPQPGHPSSSPDTVVSKSPKRQAEDELDAGEAKRLKEDDCLGGERSPRLGTSSDALGAADGQVIKAQTEKGKQDEAKAEEEAEERAAPSAPPRQKDAQDHDTTAAGNS